MRVALVVALLSLAGAAAAAPDSAQAPSSADAAGGDSPAGDPAGAVRALGRVDRSGGEATVTVPKLGGEAPVQTRPLPPGTR